MNEFFESRFEGDLELPAVPDDFTVRLADRVKDGLLRRGSRHRANYEVRESSPDGIVFAAADWSTGINLGLNEVAIDRGDGERLHYTVRYPVWARYVRWLSAGIALVGYALYVIPAIRGEVRSYPMGEYFYFGMLGFWGFLWPNLLIGLHKGAAARCLERILREELAPVGSEEMRRS